MRREGSVLLPGPPHEHPGRSAPRPGLREEQDSAACAGRGVLRAPSCRGPGRVRGSCSQWLLVGKGTRSFEEICAGLTSHCVPFSFQSVPYTKIKMKKVHAHIQPLKGKAVAAAGAAGAAACTKVGPHGWRLRGAGWNRVEAEGAAALSALRVLTLEGDTVGKWSQRLPEERTGSEEDRALLALGLCRKWPPLGWRGWPGTTPGTRSICIPHPGTPPWPLSGAWALALQP